MGYLALTDGTHWWNFQQREPHRATKASNLLAKSRVSLLLSASDISRGPDYIVYKCTFPVDQ